MNPERAKLKTGLLTPTEARRRLRLPKPIFEVLMRSGLLGPTTNSGHLFAQSLSYFERYGTQWHTQERFGAEGWGQRLISEDTYENMPPVPGMESGAPTDTYTHMRVSAPGTPDNIEETDTGWIAHFYLFPNYFMWPNTTELAMLVPPPLKISEPRDVPGTRHPTRLYPEPSGSLSLVVVSSRERPRDAENPFSAAFDQAYDTAVGVLDYLSVEYDTPLPIVHSALIGVPSGTVHLFFAHRPKVRIMSRGDNLSSEPPSPGVTCCLCSLP